ncbi:MAG: RluA family pseudouridine synthase [Thermodesulfobacteriaceae bacterium]|nr:RluA family pseudouridine synthase [Thermodesulfobacteriaceae bacterium]MCX8041260.1 RluA family pseudouridine synthase [Thermodesulfobacteriaceae bacterium]
MEEISYKEIYTFKVSEKEVGLRLDSFIKTKLSSWSRNRIQNLVEDKRVLVNGKLVKPSYKVKKDDQVEIRVPLEREWEIVPQEVPFEILYEDKDLAVIVKPSGMVVHPSAGHWEKTLVHGLMSKLKNLSGIGGKLRPGIVHRLDKDTSGVMLVAKNDFTHQKLVEAFKKREIEKIYYALVFGHPNFKEKIIKTYLGRHPVYRKKIAVLKDKGRLAITWCQVIELLFKSALLLVKPLTGRTHQIRVHLSFLGHPILGDPIYGGLKYEIPSPPRLMLHAYQISFSHPRTLEKLTFKAELPEDFKTYIKTLKNKKS